MTGQELGLRQDTLNIHWLCVDVGYTYTRFGVWTGSVFAQIWRVPTIDTRALHGTVASLRREAWLAWLLEQLAPIRLQWPQIAQLGLCFPGIVGADGTIWRSNSIWGNADSDLPASSLTDALGIPVTVVNDLAAAVVRYGEDPMLSGAKSVMVLSVSSGIGAKLYDCAARQVVMEARGRNGELGLAVVDTGPDALTNANGRLRGILGNYSSGVGFANLTRRAANSNRDSYSGSLLCQSLQERGKTLETADRVLVNQLAVVAIQAGDRFTSAVLAESIGYLAYALHFLILFNAPDRLIITGGFAASLGEHYRCELRDQLQQHLRLMYDDHDLDRMIIMGRDDDMDNLIGLATWLGGKARRVAKQSD